MFIIPEVRQSPRRQHGAGGNVILALQLDRGDEIFSQRERAPKPVPGEADAQILGHQFLLLVLEFLSRFAVDRVHRKEPPPIALPFRLVKPLDRENEISDVHGDSAQPLVVLVRVCATGSQQLDHRAERSALIQNTTAAFHIRRILKPAREVPLEDLLNRCHVLLKICDKNRPGQNGVSDGLRDFRLAATGYRARLVAKDPLGGIAHETPMPSHRTAHHGNLVARRQHIRDARRQPDMLGDALPRPGNALFPQPHDRILRNVLDVGESLVNSIPFRLKTHEIAALPDHLRKGMVHLLDEIAQVKLFAQVISGIGDHATGVFLLCVAQQISGETNLSFHLFFTVAKIVVGNHRDHDAGSVPASHLEPAAVVVALFTGLPAHAVAFLPFGGLGNMRQP